MVEKYKNLNNPIPFEKRAEVNEKILHLIHTNSAEQYGITKEVVYNSYTGDGGLSGLQLKDFSSFHAYTKAKQEYENGQFFTPHETAKYICDILNIPANNNVLDLTCGSGIFFNFLTHCNLYGNELDNKAVEVCRYLYPEVNLIYGDMIDYKIIIKFDYIIGNPPFNLDIRYEREYLKSQMVYVMIAERLLKKGGILAIIAPQSFLADEFSNKSDIEYMNTHFNFIGQESLETDTFKNVGVDNFGAKIIMFSKKSEYIKDNKYTTEYTDLKLSLNKFYNEYKLKRNDITLENRKVINLSDEFEFKVKKYMFDIKRNAFNKFHESQNLINKFYTQSKPDNISCEQWEKGKLTEEKVLRALKKSISEQHGKKWGNKHIASTKEDKMLHIPFDELKIYDSIQQEITKPIHDYMKNEDIYLNEQQLIIVNKMLQKKYGYIQSSQGTGKTLMSIFYAKYRKTKNTLVIAPAIAINTTWQETLTNYHIPFVNIKSYKDIKKIKENDFIIIGFEMLNKYVKYLKKVLPKNSTLILDEADSIANINSKRTKSTLSIGQKLRYKLLLSGTMTRNNITEAFAQFLLMYGSSANFICENKYILQEDKDTKELVTKINPNFNKPFPYYTRGYKLFQESFNPRKVTVFGAEQNTQEVYNPDDLKRIINRSVITRTFEQVVGKNLYKIYQHNIKMNDDERELYRVATEEFFKMKHLFSSTGNARKDRMMEIIQQITLLLNICRHPSTYGNISTPNKYKKVLELCNSHSNERVAIGTRTLKEVKEYTKLLKETNRELFVITGSTNMDKRLEIIEKLRNTTNGILISTQQSLSVSVNIDFVNFIIITSNSWNYSTLSQFFFRFIRYTSKEQKEIHIITYKNTIENNLLYLISQKEELTNFMKNEESENILERLGVNYNLVDMLLIKSRDKDGVKIKCKGDD